MKMKRFLGAVGMLLFCVTVGVCVWYFFLSGSNQKDMVSIPESPENSYTGFFYQKLEDNEKIAYELIMKNIFDFPEKIEIPLLDDEGLSEVFEAIVYDDEEIFFLSDVCQTKTNGKHCFFVPKYSINKEEYEVKLAKLKLIKSDVLQNTSSCESSFEIEKYIHDFIIDKCTYEEKTGGDYSSAYGCLVNGKASCEGYTRAAKYLLDAVGIENHFALGTLSDSSRDSLGHAWNIVNIDGKWYHLDVTWDDPYGGEAECRYTFFNLSDDMIKVTHNMEKRFLGECVSDEQNYYIVNKICFDSYDGNTRSGIAKEIARQADDGIDVTSVQFKNKDVFEQAKNSLFDADGIYNVLMTASVLSASTISKSKVVYSLDEKHYIIHLSGYLEK